MKLFFSIEIIVFSILILLFGVLESKSLSVFFHNDIDDSLQIRQVEIGRTRKTVDKIVLKNSGTPPPFAAGWITVPDDAFANELRVTLFDGRQLACVIKDKSFFLSCSVRAGISKSGELQCACDGMHDFD